MISPDLDILDEKRSHVAEPAKQIVGGSATKNE